jgi:peptidoglycan/xylan/chitin deacetylase (PgdA/CDA1 family)
MTTFSRRDFLRLSGAALLSAAFPALRLPGTDPFDPSVIYRGSLKYPKIALTFDDCWHPEVLQQLMTMLEPYPDFHFTFFAIGDAIDINEAVKPGITKMLYDKGHEIGYHTYHHVDPQVMTTAALVSDFDQWMRMMQRVLGSVPKVHFARPPYDDLSLSFQELCLKRGLVATLYSTGFEATSMDESMRLISRAGNGDIVQMHTYQDPPHGRFDVSITAKAVPYLAGQGFTLVTMSQLYDDVLRDEHSSDGCDVGMGSSLTRTCLE